ncbi:hypothetical protein [Thermoflavimicrobium daqui]|uniref:Uncharacterized protein n=1 Tax=Thermoflavimicrobium daqui TaxID=2137476 RepID=A0A364K7M4_9BACL|nr:hypothetical protein [Thermoflavimicrobium daqui]RAL26301.1 hypothetical protein DL897_04715 [Thermoflavimicrobium daqui]
MPGKKNKYFEDMSRAFSKELSRQLSKEIEIQLQKLLRKEIYLYLNEILSQEKVNEMIKNSSSRTLYLIDALKPEVKDKVTLSIVKALNKAIQKPD